jgi:hypothetical protein
MSFDDVKSRAVEFYGVPTEQVRNPRVGDNLFAAPFSEQWFRNIVPSLESGFVRSFYEGSASTIASGAAGTVGLMTFAPQLGLMIMGGTVVSGMVGFGLSRKFGMRGFKKSKQHLAGAASMLVDEFELWLKERYNLVWDDKPKKKEILSFADYFFTGGTRPIICNEKNLNIVISSYSSTGAWIQDPSTNKEYVVPKKQLVKPIPDVEQSNLPVLSKKSNDVLTRINGRLAQLADMKLSPEDAHAVDRVKNDADNLIEVRTQILKLNNQEKESSSIPRILATLEKELVRIVDNHVDALKRQMLIQESYINERNVPEHSQLRLEEM